MSSQDTFTRPEARLTIASVVFVHGIRGDARRTWTSTQHRQENKPEKKVRRGFSRFKGLGGSSSSVAPDSIAPVFWPEDFLLNDVSGLRVITFGYNADVSAFLNRTSDSSIFSIAQDLIVRLEMLREKNGHVSKAETSPGQQLTPSKDKVPIIFVAHSLGGLVVKDVRPRTILDFMMYR